MNSTLLREKKAMTIGQAKNKDMLICFGSDVLYHDFNEMHVFEHIFVGTFASLQQGVYIHFALVIYIYTHTRITFS
jgi:uncharacterized membrane protein